MLNSVPQQQKKSLYLPFSFTTTALYRSTSPHATLHAEIYQPTFKTLTGSSNVSKSWKETKRRVKKHFFKHGKMLAKCETCQVGISARAAHALSGLSRQVSAYRLPPSYNLEGMSMNIQRKSSTYHFRMQSEREQTLGLNIAY